MPQKYIFQNGVPVINPAYQDPNSPAPSAPPLYTPADQPLAVASTMEDQMAVTQLTQLPVPQQIQDTVSTMQDPAYLSKFKVKGIDGGTLIDGLTSLFGQYEIPIGLMSKLTPYQGVKLHFKIDNSGSMTSDSNLLRRDASQYMQQVGNLSKTYLTRWEEAQDRMHIMIDLLGYVPTGPIILSYFDHPGQPGARIILDRNGKTPETFISDAHATITKLFNVRPSGGTPILLNMTNMLTEANATRAQTDTRTMHFLLSDGEPSNGAEEIRLVKNLLVSPQRYPALNPVTFLGCSNRHEDYAWMHELEEVADYVAVLPDFVDERNEVMKSQGKVFPYTRGFWLLCNLAAATNPDDLDALDQHAPFTKPTLENLMGRGLTEPEYNRYFSCHPNAVRVFGPDYQLFLTTPVARTLPSVNLFLSTLKNRLNQDLDNDEDDTEAQDVLYAEQVVINTRNNARTSQYSGSMYYSSSAGAQPPSYQASAYSTSMNPFQRRR